MNLTRALFLMLAVTLPATWTIAHAEDAPAGEAKEAKPKKKGKKKEKKEGEEPKTDDKK
jgi:hypothetical protein